MPTNSRNKSSKWSKCEGLYTEVWTCSNCSNSGMTTFIDHCSDCQHLRCWECPTQLIKTYEGLPRSIVRCRPIPGDRRDYSYYDPSRDVAEPSLPANVEANKTETHGLPKRKNPTANVPQLQMIEKRQRKEAVNPGPPKAAIVEKDTELRDLAGPQDEGNFKEFQSHTLDLTASPRAKDRNPVSTYEIKPPDRSTRAAQTDQNHNTTTSSDPPSNSPSTEYSATPSDIFTNRESSVRSESDIDMQEASDSEDEPHAAFTTRATELELLLRVLEPQIFALFEHMLPFAALLLPRIYQLSKREITDSFPKSSSPNEALECDEAGECSRFHRQGSSSNRQNPPMIMGTTDNRQAQNSVSQSAGSSCNESSTFSLINSSRTSQPHQKRGRSPDESENPDGPAPLKRSRQEVMKAPIITFACHFHKFDSAKYGPWTDRKYRKCVAPAVPYDRLSRIKDHYKAAHRAPQCNRCFAIFKDSTRLVEHYEQPVSCDLGPRELKEGIDEGQWGMIEKILKAKGKHEVEKWYEIWENVLFPGVPRPETPWNEPQTQSNSSVPDLETFMGSFENGLEQIIQQGLLQVDTTVYHTLMNAARQAFSGVTGQSEIRVQGSGQSRDNPLGPSSLRRMTPLEQESTNLEDHQMDFAALADMPISNLNTEQESFPGSYSEQIFPNLLAPGQTEGFGSTEVNDDLVMNTLGGLPLVVTDNFLPTTSMSTNEMHSANHIYADEFFGPEFDSEMDINFNLDNGVSSNQTMQPEAILPSFGMDLAETGRSSDLENGFVDIFEDELQLLRAGLARVRLLGHEFGEVL